MLKNAVSRFASFKFAGLLLLSPLLTACSGEPSASDIASAYDRAFADQAKLMAGVSNSRFKPSTAQIKKYDCSGSDQGRYRCRFQLITVSGRTGKKDTPRDVSAVLEKI